MNQLVKLKIILSILLLIIGCICTYVTYDMQNEYLNGTLRYIAEFRQANGDAATGMGIIAGLSMLSSAILLASINTKSHNES